MCFAELCSALPYTRLSRRTPTLCWQLWLLAPWRTLKLFVSVAHCGLAVLAKGAFSAFTFGIFVCTWIRESSRELFHCCTFAIHVTSKEGKYRPLFSLGELTSIMIYSFNNRDKLLPITLLCYYDLHELALTCMSRLATPLQVDANQRKSNFHGLA